MKVRPDFIAYHKSIGAEFSALRDRVRDLIGASHWLSDGEYKEAVLRRLLRAYLPEAYTVGRGFVLCANGELTRQVDIMIVRRDTATLFRDGDLMVVTPEGVRAIIEVKTRLESKNAIRKAAERLMSNSAKIWPPSAGDERLPGTNGWVGLFVYEQRDTTQGCAEATLEAIEAARAHVTTADNRNGEFQRLRCACFGSDTLVREWPDPPRWKAYKLTGLAPAYFISNVVAELSAVAIENRRAWFPYEEGKAPHTVAELQFRRRGAGR